MNFTTGTLCTICLSLMLAACDSGSSAAEHVASAKQYIASGEQDAAEIELKNALQKDNQSAEARWLLGKTYLDSGDVLSAEKELQHALQLGWSQNDVLPALALSLLAQRKYAEVRELDDTGLQPRAEADVLAAKSLSALALGENRKAGKLVNKALGKAPDSTQALLAKARILASQGDLTATQAVLENLIELDPENASAWSLLGDTRTGQQKPEEALIAYNKALSYQPKNYNVIFKRALLSLQSGDYEAAQADATELLRIGPQSPGGNYVQGLIHFQAERYSEAITALSLAEPAFSQLTEGLFFLGSAQLIEGNLDQAAVHAARFHDVAPDSIRGRKLLATIRLQQGKYREVQELLGPVLDMDPDDVGALNLMSNALLRDGKTEEGISMLSRVATLQPDSAVAQVRLGAGLLAGGKGDEAAQHIETALELDPEFQQADILLVMNHLRKQDYDAAIAAAKNYRRRNLTSTTPLNLLGKVYQQAGRQDEAREAFEKALTLDASDPAANHNLAQMAVASGDLTAARQYYATLLEHHQDYLPALIQLALLDVKEEKEASLVEHLEQAIRAHPAALEPRLLLGRYHLSKGRPEKVAPLFTNLEEAQKQSPQVLQLLALAQLSEKEHGEAQFTLEQLMQSTPDSAPLHHMMAMAAAGAGNPERAEQELHRAIELDENYLPSRIALARLALAKGTADEFEQQIAALESLAPDNPDVLLLRAASANREGDPAAAVTLAEQAFTLAPTVKTVLALGSYQEASGDHNGALQLYRSWINENPQDVAVRMAIANSLQIKQEAEAAMIYYKEVLLLDPDNVIALNNLAWNLREENPGKALEYARHASTLAPESADVLDTLAVVEYFNSEYKLAQRNVERALSLSPDNPSLLYHSAMISAALGDSKAAISTLEALLEEGTDFPEMEQADALLAQLRR